MSGKVYWKDKEVLRVNEKYVEGYGWLNQEQYEKAMNENAGAGSFFNKITTYNIQYKEADGRTGQMDIPTEEFWKHRLFSEDKNSFSLYGFEIELKPNSLFSIALHDSLGGDYQEDELTFKQALDWIWNMADNHDISHEVIGKMCSVFGEGKLSS
jgi:hypothetical protein